VTTPEALLDIAERALSVALAAGAEQAEICAEAVRTADVELQKDDIHSAATREETSFGVRVLSRGAEGFATVNHRDRLADACRQAVEIARVSPSDPHNGFAEPRPVQPLGTEPDPEIASIDVAMLVDLAARLVERVKARDARVRIDSGEIGTAVVARAIATSTGIRLAEARASAGGSLFGMAVDGDDVGSFDYDGQLVCRKSELEPELELAVERFVDKTVGALGAKKGESFRGTVILTPEVVSAFVLGDLLAMVNARAVRTGRSPLAGKLGETIAAPQVSIVDDPRMPFGTASGAFDREGTPTTRTLIVDRGVLSGYLYDVYEARRAERPPTGHARGGAAGRPNIGPSNVIFEPGELSLESLSTQAERAVLVTRLSESSNPTTGEFSGVVKGGFLLSRGARVPIKETMIAGNLYDVLKAVSAVTADTRWLGGSQRVPALRVEGISVTAG
jgi:PmbA protein